MMQAQYDAIASQYRQTRTSPLRTWVEVPSFLSLAGDLRGLRILDLACGDGFYSRRFLELGAAAVVGVDISPAMLDLARATEMPSDDRIDYVCADVASLPELGSFDLVAGTYLLHYAADVDGLRRMCAGIARNLRPGGRFIGLNENPDQPCEPRGGYGGYGFSKTIDGDAVDGAEITYRMLAGRDVFSFNARYFQRNTYQQAFDAAGLEGLRWHPLRADPAGITERGAAYFEHYLAYPPVSCIEARRP